MNCSSTSGQQSCCAVDPEFHFDQRGRGDRIETLFAACMSLLLAQSGHAEATWGCLLSDEKRTHRRYAAPQVLGFFGLWGAVVAAGLY